MDFQMVHLNAVLNVATLLYVVWRTEALHAKLYASTSWWKLAKEWYESSRNANQDGKRILNDVKSQAEELKETVAKVQTVATESKAQVEVAIQQAATDLSHKVEEIPDKTVEKIVQKGDSGVIR